MRYVRFEFKDINGVNRRRIILKFFIILPAAIAAGFLISRLYIVPRISSVVVQQEPEYTYQEMRHRRYYSIQMGAFASRDNAQSFAAGLRNSGIPAYIDDGDKYSFVFAYTGTERKTAEDKAQYYRNMGYTSLIKRLDIVPDGVTEDYKINKKHILLSMLVNDTGSFIDGCSSALCDFEEGKCNFNEMIGNVNEQYIKVHECFEQYLKDGELTDDEYKGWKTLDNIMQEMTAINNDEQFYVRFNENLMQAAYTFNSLVQDINRSINDGR